MSTTLDSFFQVPKSIPEVPETTSVEPRCSKCGKSISEKDPKYTLTIKGKAAVHCQPCAKRILRPQENTEESL